MEAATATVIPFADYVTDGWERVPDTRRAWDTIIRSASDDDAAAYAVMVIASPPSHAASPVVQAQAPGGEWVRVMDPAERAGILGTLINDLVQHLVEIGA